MNKLHLVELMQTTFNHLVVIMLGSDKVELLHTSFNHLRCLNNVCIIWTMSEPNMITTRWLNVVCMISNWLNDMITTSWIIVWIISTLSKPNMITTKWLNAIQPCLNQLSSLPVVIMLGSNKVEMMQTTFNQMVVMMVGSDMVQMMQTTLNHLVVMMVASDMAKMMQTTFNSFTLVVMMESSDKVD